jgi:hypothetical protein
VGINVAKSYSPSVGARGAAFQMALMLFGPRAWRLAADSNDTGSDNAAGCG